MGGADGSRFYIFVLRNKSRAQPSSRKVVQSWNRLIIDMESDGGDLEFSDLDSDSRRKNMLKNSTIWSITVT